MPLCAIDHVSSIADLEIAVAVMLAGGDGSASVVPDATADIGEMLPYWSTSATT
jgi:hypothetical protein